MERLKFWGVMQFKSHCSTGFFTRSVGAYQRGSFCSIWRKEIQTCQISET